MAFIKEESDDIRIEESFGVKHEEQTGWFSFSKLYGPLHFLNVFAFGRCFCTQTALLKLSCFKRISALFIASFKFS